MKNNIIEYLEYILPTHNCVVIPDFGGFIVDIEPAKILADKIVSPTYKILFNQELKHNDGILASYLTKEYKMNYNIACEQIKQQVKELKKDIYAGKVVQCGSLGTLFSTAKGQIIFKENNKLIHPALFGLSQVELARLTDIEFNLRQQHKTKIVRDRVVILAAAGLALFFLMFPSINISEQSAKYQSASFIYSLSPAVVVKKNVLDKEDNNENAVIRNIEKTKGYSNLANSQPKILEQEKVKRIYYIVLAGENTKSKAEKTLAMIKSEGFSDASIFVSGGRYRIYSDVFKNKTEANNYLDNLRKTSRFKTAWLYSRKP